jgi:hypothetical protein
MELTALRAKHIAQDAKEAMHAQIQDLLKEYNVLQQQDFFHMKAILIASNARLERNVLS